MVVVVGFVLSEFLVDSFVYQKLSEIGTVKCINRMNKLIEESINTDKRVSLNSIYLLNTRQARIYAQYQ